LLKRLLKFLSARPVATGAVTLGLLGTSVGAGVTILAPPGGGGGGAPADYYIATTGSDSNSGTQGSPFLTMNKCADQQRTAAIVCEMAAGTYAGQSLDASVGTRTATVTFRPASGASVTIGKATTLNGENNWTADGVANDTVTVASTTGMPESSADCSPVGAPCTDLIVGSPIIRCPSSTKTAGGWTGCNLADGASTNPPKFYNGGTIIANVGLFIAQDYVHVKDVNAVKWTVAKGTQVPNNVTIENSVTKSFDIQETTGLTVKGGTYGNTTTCFAAAGQVASNLGAGNRPSGVVLDGVTIENINTDDYGGSTASACHQEALKLYSTAGVTIKNSIMKAYSVQGLFVEQLGSVGTDNLTLENNFIGLSYGDTNGAAEGGATRGAAGACIHIKDFTTVTYTNIKIRYNSLADGCVVDLLSGTYSGSEFKGNIFESVGCPAGWTHSYNVWSVAVGCGTNSTGSVNLTDEYVSDSTENLHLVVGATSISKGDPADCPAADIDAETRPISTCDAGADEG
jgi:hypothetical protein